MKKTAAVFVSIGVILVIVGLVIVGIAGRDALKNFSWSDLINGYSHDLTKANASKEITDITELSKIKISAARYSVYVLPSDNDIATVKYVEPLEGDANITVNCVDGILTITETDTLKNGIFSGFNSNRFVAVYLPQTELFTQAELYAEVSSAAVSVQNINSKTFTGTAQTGRISVSGGNITQVNLKTNTGAVTADKLNCEDLQITTDTGAVNVTETVATAAINIDVNTGSVNCNVTCSKLSVHGDTGSVNFKATADNIEVSTDTGSVNGTVMGNKDEYSITVLKDTGSSNIQSQHVENAVKFLKVEVDTGSINIKFQNN